MFVRSVRLKIGIHEIHEIHCVIVEIPLTYSHTTIYFCCYKTMSLLSAFVALSLFVLSVDFWATVCKTVRPMLSDRCPVCPVCDVGVLWSNGWIDQDETGMEVGLAQATLC